MDENNHESERLDNNQEKNNIFNNKIKELFSWQWIIIMIGIVILVVASFLYFRHKISSPTIETSPINNTSSNKTTTSLTSSTPAQPSTTETQAKNSTTKNQTADNNKKSKQKQPISQEIQIQDKSITVSAAPGDGITQLARRALSEYIKQHPDTGKKLTKEHRVYIEDYLKDRIVKNRNGRKMLVVSEKVSFSTDLIYNAIQNSQKLTQKQLNYLKIFSQRIDWSKA